MFQFRGSEPQDRLRFREDHMRDMEEPAAVEDIGLSSAYVRRRYGFRSSSSSVFLRLRSSLIVK
jgi:hypothetical protein